MVLVPALAGGFLSRMDGLEYYSAFIFIAWQIVTNGAGLVVGAVRSLRGGSRQEGEGERRMDAINEFAFMGFAVFSGAVLLKLLVDGAFTPWNVIVAGACIEASRLLLKHLYAKRVPTPGQLEMPNRYFPHTTAQAFVEEAHLRPQERRASKWADDNP